MTKGRKGLAMTRGRKELVTTKEKDFTNDKYKKGPTITIRKSRHRK